MIYKYLIQTRERIKNMFIPKHPLTTRAYELPDGTLVEAGTYEDHKCDEVPAMVAVSVTDFIKSGQTPPKCGGISSTTILPQAVFAQQFVKAFNAAATPASAPAPAQESINEPKTE